MITRVGVQPQDVTTDEMVINSFRWSTAMCLDREGVVVVR